MAEPEEPRRIPLGPPGGPIPRIWKVEPEEEPEEEEPPKKKKPPPPPPPVVRKPKPKKKPKGSKNGEAGEKGALIEETPALETYEGRRLLRVASGVLILLVVFLVGFGIYKMFGSGDSEIPELADDGVPSQPPVDPRQVERDSKYMLERAHAVAEKGNTTLAAAILMKLKETYPESSSAKAATVALDRSRKELPLFSDLPAVAKAEPKAADAPKPATEPMKAADAAKSVAPGAAKLGPPPTAPAQSEQVAVATSKAEMSRPSAKTETPSRPLPAGFRMREGTRIHTSGWPNEIVGDRDTGLMVFIPGGTFTMGRDDGEPSEAPSHKVTMTAYYIDQHEVTVRQYGQFEKASGKRPERTRALSKLEDNASQSEDFPVVMVSARDCDEYAQWAGKQLPTEAQWEFAARGTDGRLYPWGTEGPQWAKPRKPRQIDPVNSFSIDVSPFGIADMAGNAWEWTRDWYDPKYHHQFRSGPVTNPMGPSTKPRSNQLAVRGTAKNWTATKRDGFKSDTRLPYLGFRCVLQVEGQGNAQVPTQAPVNPPAQSSGPIPF